MKRHLFPLLLAILAISWLGSRTAVGQQRPPVRIERGNAVPPWVENRPGLAFPVAPASARSRQTDGRLPRPVLVARTFRQPTEKKPDGFKQIGEIRVNEPATGLVPEDKSKEIFEPQAVVGYQRGWPVRQLNWQASEFWHQPLYWDYVPWDYNGQWSHRLLQPWQSGVHFFCTFPILPYKMGLDRPFDRVYTLGKERPGNASPRLRQRLPWQWDAISWETAAWVGAAYIFP